MTTVAQPELVEPEGLDAAEVPGGAGPRPGASLGERLRRRWRGLLIRPVLLAIVLIVLWLVVSNSTLDSIEQRNLNWKEIRLELGQHIHLSLVATFFTVIIAVPLGIVLTRPAARLLRPLALGIANLGQAIPSFGLVLLLALWTDIGFTIAVVALVVYAALPVLRNTIVGLEGVDRNLVEAARGMGMSKLAVLGRIELPLAVPVILAGIRTALVLTVASATLASFIDAGGLGFGLYTGITLDRKIVAVTYGVIAAALALFADWLGLLVEEVLRPRGV
jgi:osmoprotectant transport system permease protein